MVSVWRQIRPGLKTRELILIMLCTGSIVAGIGYLMPNAWEPVFRQDGIVYALIDQWPLDIIGHTAIYSIGLGLFLGVAALWLDDRFKRFPGVTVWSGILVGLFVLGRSWSNPSSSDFLTGFVALGVGAVAGLQLGGLPIIQRIYGEKQVLRPRPIDRRFPRAVRFTFVFVLGLGVVGLMNQHVSLSGGFIAGEDLETLPGHLIALLAVLIPLGFFQSYKDTEQIIQLGPAKSGKTSTQGGLYMSVDEPVERNTQLIDDIYENHMQWGRFPDRTRLEPKETSVVHLENETEGGNGDDALIIEFSYITLGTLFPKEKFITTVDYPGEILTGKGEERGLAAHIDEYGERDGSWGTVMENLRGQGRFGTEEFTLDEFRSELAALVCNADTIIFTLPLDDFLSPIIEHRPENVQKYHKEKIWVIKRSGDDDDVDYKVRKLGSDDEWVKLYRDGDRFAPKERTELRGLSDEKESWRGGEKVHYVRSGRGRQHPTRYLGEYQDIVDALPDLRNHQFIWLTTMADLVLKDFKRVAESADPDKESTRTRTDIDIDYLDESDLWDNPEGWTPALESEEYKVFSEWIKNEYLRTEEPAFETYLDTTRENHVFPVWFDIDDETEDHFSVESTALRGDSQALKGSSHLTSRFRGERLRKEYSDGPMSLFSSKIPLGQTRIPDSLSEMSAKLLQESDHTDRDNHER